MCTDANNSDTDGDGLSDGLEIGQSTGVQISDPCSPDSDGDGINDNWEYTHGSDPNSFDVFEDTDSDGLSNWSNYISEKKQQYTDDNITALAGEYLLDLRGLDAAVRTSVIPKEPESMTYMAWFKFDSLSGTQLMGLNARNYYRFYFGVSNGMVSVGGGNAYRKYSQSLFGSNEWVHIALTRQDGGSYSYDDFKVFVNGVEIGTFLGKYNTQTFRNLIIGAVHKANDVNSYMNVLIDDVQIWSKALSNTEIQTYMQTLPVQGEPELMVLYDFNTVWGELIFNTATGEYDAVLSDESAVVTGSKSSN